MTHLDDGMLQSFLDDELPPPRRAAVAEHLLGCTACHDRYEGLAQANALFSRSVSILDVEASEPVPAGGALGRGTHSGTSALIKAASLVLALAAAASAAVPGSPVREWIAGGTQTEAEPELPSAEPETREAAPAPGPPVAPAGVSVGPAGGRLVVALEGAASTLIRLETVEGERATVSVAGASPDPVFRTRAGRVEVRQGAGGELRVALPRSVEGARLEVEGRLFAEVQGGELRVHQPADSVGGYVVWR